MSDLQDLWTDDRKFSTVWYRGELKIDFGTVSPRKFLANLLIQFLVVYLDDYQAIVIEKHLVKL